MNRFYQVLGAVVLLTARVTKAADDVGVELQIEHQNVTPQMIYQP
jgi:casein kinase II subunit alpha